MNAASPTTPWYQSKTLWAAAVSAVSGVPVLAEQLRLAPITLSDEVRTVLAIVSVVAAWLAPILARAAAEAGVKNLETALKPEPIQTPEEEPPHAPSR